LRGIYKKDVAVFFGLRSNEAGKEWGEERISRGIVIYNNQFSSASRWI
jgi:hypothetical protein